MAAVSMQDARAAGRARSKRARAHAPIIPFLVLFGVFYVVPIAYMLVQSVTDPHLGLGNYGHILSERLYLKTAFFTIWFSALEAAVCLVVAYPVSLLMALTSGIRRKALLALLLLPFWISLLVRTYAWVVILTSGGPLDQVTGAIGLDSPSILYSPGAVFIGMLHILLPYMILVLYPVVRDVDESYVKAAQSLGASTMRVFATVYVPLTFAAMIQGLTLTFIMAVGFFVTPAILGGGNVTTLPMLVDTLTQDLLKYGLAGALSVLLIVIVAAILLLARRRLSLGASGVGRA
jgi:putative spermidine/putrescine transport system permease protein